MPFFTSPIDGATLYYADHRPSTTSSIPPFQSAADRDTNLKKDLALILLHGWPMSNRMWHRQLLPLSESHGIRCIAPDRRGFGRSEWSGVDSKQDVTYETFAADTAALLRSIKDLRDFVFVGSSMGCGESVLVARLLEKEKGWPRCRGFMWLAPSLPYPLQTEDYPTAPPRELWDAILGGLRNDREGFVKASIGSVFGTHAGVAVSDDDLQFFVSLIRDNDIVAVERCVQAFSRMDFSKELKSLQSAMGKQAEVVVVAGKEDNNWPPEAGPLRIKDLIPGAEVQVWDGAAHGLYWTHADKVNDLILDMWKRVVL